MTGTIFPQSGDELNETNLGQTLALAHQSNYVERGLGFDPDFQANTLDISSGMAIIRDGDIGWTVTADGETGIVLPVTSGVNYIYLTANTSDTSTTAVTFDALDTDTPPGPTSLKIGEVDTSGDTWSELNRDLPIDTENIDASLLGGNPPSYYASVDSPSFTGSSAVFSGSGFTLELGEIAQGGPHTLLFGNGPNTSVDRGSLVFRTAPEEVRIENYTSGDIIASFPIDGTTKPTVWGEPIKTGEGSADVFIGPDPPSNPDSDTVWIDTS